MKCHKMNGICTAPHLFDENVIGKIKSFKQNILTIKVLMQSVTRKFLKVETLMAMSLGSGFPIFRITTFRVF